MAPLVDRDVRAAQELGRLIEGPLGDAVNTVFLEELAGLVPAQYAEYTERDAKSQRILVRVAQPVVRPDALDRHVSVAIPSPRGRENVLRLERHGQNFDSRDRTVLGLVASLLEARLRAVALQRRVDWLLAWQRGEGRWDQLTMREQDVITLVAVGSSNGEVARVLGITPLTVRKHLENIFAKLEVHNRMAAVRAVGMMQSRVRPVLPSGLPIQRQGDEHGQREDPQQQARAAPPRVIGEQPHDALDGEEHTGDDRVLGAAATGEQPLVTSPMRTPGQSPA
jgi:DNA-binding CsgD family transcriptional regulator